VEKKKNAGNFHFGKGTEWKVTKLFGAFVAVNKTHRVSELFIKGSIMSKKSKEEPAASDSGSSEEEEVIACTIVCSNSDLNLP